MENKREKPIVLHIDDEPDTLSFARLALDAVGLKTLTAPSAKEGIALAEKELPDVILMDVQMPEIDGHRACWILKQNPKTKHIPIIMVTVQDQMRQVKKAVNLGASEYIIKPFKKEDLVAKVYEVINSKTESA